MEMIAPQELRLNNLLEYPGWNKDNTPKYFRVRDIFWEDSNIGLTDGIIKVPKTKLNNLKPIELTEEWLLKFGFFKREDEKYYHHKYDRTWVKIESCIVKWYGNAVGALVMIDFVHQLQNCFNVFTRDELTIKEKYDT